MSEVYTDNNTLPKNVCSFYAYIADLGSLLALNSNVKTMVI